MVLQLHSGKQNSTPALAVCNACIGYDSHLIIEDVSLTVQTGDWITLLGPNGSGKTTLLKALLGTLPLASGNRVSTFNKCGYVPQRFSLSIQSPIKVNEFLNLNPFHRECEQSYHNHLLKELMLTPLLEHHLQSLSGGQLQRVLLAYALCGNPEIVFLDEFLGGIDCESNKRALDILSHRNKNGLTIVEVSHDVSTVVEHANRVVLVKGHILFDGKPGDEHFKERYLAAHQDHEWVQNAKLP